MDGYPTYDLTRSISPATIDPSTVEITTASTSIVSGGEGRFDIRVQDVFGNKLCPILTDCQDPAPPSVFLTHQTGMKISAHPTFDKVQSVFRYLFVATVSGQYLISVAVRDKSVSFKPPPYVLVLPADADAGSFLIHWEPVYPAGPVSVFMQARDKYSNNISRGGDSIQVVCIHHHAERNVVWGIENRAYSLIFADN